jgi:hypothetical protein
MVLDSELTIKNKNWKFILPLIPLEPHQSIKQEPIQQLFVQSWTCTLKPSQIQELLLILRADPLMIHETSSLEWLSILEKNPLLAQELLLMKLNSLEFNEYFIKLNTLPICLPWIECIYLLAPSLSSDQLYEALVWKIGECCQETDHHKVLLLVKLIQSLATVLPRLVVDLRPELESFCIHFAKIKQVSSLYKDLLTR